MTPPWLIYETANVHGGQVGVLFELIDALARTPYQRRAIKFHPIAADTLALPDFSAYGVYRALQISNAAWSKVIARARNAIGRVWLEAADLNCVQVLQENNSLIAGVKLQASVLDNDEVFSALAQTDLASKMLMLNVSGYEPSEIAVFVERFRGLNIDSLALQIGFQGYPTAVEDTLLNKLAVLRSAFPEAQLGLADHVDAAQPFARRVPLLGAALGCALIEKHVCLDRAAAPHDGSAALEPHEVAEMAHDLELAARCFGERFIAPAEAKYLAKTLQRPVLGRALHEGQLVARQDLLFRRTDRGGLSRAEVVDLQTRHHVLAGAVEPRATLRQEDFRPAHIAAIVAGRMKSRRLPRKTVLPVHGTPSVERCLQNCLRMPYLRTVVLATSVLPEDERLEQHAFDDVRVWRGDPDNVIARYLTACDAFGIDVVVRVTADCLTISPEIAKIVLEEHFASGADFTRVRREAPGTAPQIFNVETLRRIERLSGGAGYSEYMNQYVENNPEHFKIHWVDLPEELVRPYRLTLDYPEDLKMYEALYAELDRRGVPADLRHVFAVLDARPDIAAINGHIGQVYTQDPELVATLKRVTRFART